MFLSHALTRLWDAIAPANRPYAVLAALGVCLSFIALWWGIDNSILNAWEFRQSQTGLSAYWLTQGGDWFAYETPVSGHPWTIPFEFPVYQWLMALMMELGIPMNAAGRLSSWIMFAGALWAGWVYLRETGFSQNTQLIFIGLMATAPLYMFFARAIMIESTALLLSILFLVGIAKLQTYRNNYYYIGMIILSATLAAMVKITTFFPFALVGLFHLVYFNWKATFAATGLENKARTFFHAFAAAGISILIALLALHLWTGFADDLKSMTPVGKGLTSSALTGWNFGSRENLTDLSTWQNQVAGRTLADLFGGWWVGLILVGLSILHRKYLVLQGLLIALFVFTYVVFWNLHLVHDYYQFANGIFLILAGALAIEGLRHLEFPSLPAWVTKAAPLAVIILVIGAQTYRFVDHFGWAVRSNQKYSHTAVYAMLLRERVGPESVGVAIGFDWNSILAYESRRRVITAPAFSFWEFEREPNMTLWTGGRPIDVVIDCDRVNTPQSRAFVDAAAEGLRGYRFLDCTVFDRVGESVDIDAMRDKYYR